LGIPTVLDRLIQQAVMQVLQERWDPDFSDHSYGFRPRKSAHQAIAQAQRYIAAGCSWVVELDLEKFFDRVNHDRLMAQIAKRVDDKRLLKLIRAFLNAGVMENGLLSPSVEGTPQGGPLSPLLSYFGFCETTEVLIGLTRWVRLRLRCALWRQWKTPRRRRAALLQPGVRSRLASNTAGSGLGPWYLAKAKALSVGLSNAYLRSLGLPSLVEE
jgi:hypothetical protein